ncbi:MAG TPA: sugar phosphate isomerase/epimerase [Chitinophagaceae bacterium]|nr:sugar phosphate isomerase/epimerase [Chitinophagaceae bacterium]
MNKYIAIVLITAAEISVSQTALPQNSKPLYTAPLGVEAYTFRKSFPIDVAKTLDTIKMMGFTEIESGGNGLQPAAFKKLCDERGISIPATGADYGRLVNSPDSVAYVAKILGAKYVMCAWIPHKDGVLTFEDAKKAVEDFNSAGKVLRDSGIILCYHAHGYEFQPYKDGTLLDYIIKNTNPGYVSFEMDIFWMQFGGGDPVSLLKKYGNRWKLIHLKDLKKGAKKDLTGGTSTENDVTLGTGEIDIPGILKEAQKIGIKHYFIEDESDYVNEHVPQSIAYLKSLKQ